VDGFGHTRDPVCKVWGDGTVVVVSMVITAVVFVVAIGGLSSREHGPARTQTGRTPQVDAAAQRALAALDGISQSGTTLGNEHAPVTITVFADMECQVCRTFTLGSGFRELLTRQVRSGRVSLDFRSFCTSTCSGKNPSVFDAQQRAAYAAAGQNRLWDYALVFFAEQRAGSGYATTSFLDGLARQVPGLKLGRWRQARGEAAPAARLRSDAAVARTDHVIATPTLVVARGRARVTVIGAVTYRQLVRAINKVKGAPAVTPNAVVKACLATGRLTRRYSAAELRGALKAMPASVKHDTDCPNVIRRALRSAR
jgi:protein-disulfide isomerase